MNTVTDAHPEVIGALVLAAAKRMKTGKMSHQELIIEKRSMVLSVAPGTDADPGVLHHVRMRVDADQWLAVWKAASVTRDIDAWLAKQAQAVDALFQPGAPFHGLRLRMRNPTAPCETKDRWRECRWHVVSR